MASLRQEAELLKQQAEVEKMRKELKDLRGESLPLEDSRKVPVNMNSSVSKSWTSFTNTLLSLARDQPVNQIDHETLNPGRRGGGVLSEKLGGGVWPASQNPYSI